MHSTICLLALYAALFTTAQRLASGKPAAMSTLGLLFVRYLVGCATGNPCQLGGYFNASRGYQCVQVGATSLCTCPGGAYETGVPCRRKNLSERSNDSSCEFQVSAIEPIHCKMLATFKTPITFRVSKRTRTVRRSHVSAWILAVHLLSQHQRTAVCSEPSQNIFTVISSSWAQI